MGHWGHRPRDCDGASDMFALVEDAANTTALALFRGGWATRGADYGDEQRFERLGVVERMLDAGLALHKSVAKDAMAECAYFLAEGGRDYLTRFREPNKARAAVEAVRERLSELKKEVPLGLARAIHAGEAPEFEEKMAARAAAKANPKG